MVTKIMWSRRKRKEEKEEEKGGGGGILVFFQCNNVSRRGRCGREREEKLASTETVEEYEGEEC